MRSILQTKVTAGKNAAGLPLTLHGQEEKCYCDSAYASQQELIRSKAPKAADMTNQRVRKGSTTKELERLVNRSSSTPRRLSA
jgi:transposase, IS5 family